MSGKSVLERVRPRHRPLARRHSAETATSLGGLSFAALYDELHPNILRFLVVQTRLPQVGLDLTAETFARACEKQTSFRGTTHDEANAWIWAIARNELARYRRRHSVETAAIERLGLERPRASDAELRELEQLAVLEDLREQFRHHLPRLPLDQEQVIRLRFFDGLDNDAVAQRLGISNDVVRSRASRALRTLGTNEQLKAAALALLG